MFKLLGIIGNLLVAVLTFMYHGNLQASLIGYSVGVSVFLIVT